MTHTLSFCKTRASKALGPGILCLSLVAAAFGDNPAIPFTINSGRVIPSEPCALRVTVIGCANHASAHGGYERLTTMKVQVTPPAGAPVVYEPFGSFMQPVTSNVNDNRVHEFVISDTVSNQSQISITGRSWKWDGSGNLNSDWSLFQEEDSHVNNLDQMVVVLRDGDSVPNIPGFNGQAPLRAYLEPYINQASGTVQLGPNDAIYCFELAANNTSTPFYDLQDMVVVVRLGENPLNLAPSWD